MSDFHDEQSAARRRVGIACNADTRRFYLAPHDLDRLEQFADVVMLGYDIRTDGWCPTPEIPQIEEQFISSVADLDILLLGGGGPRLTKRVIAAAPRLRFVGELEGDRFGGRIDLGAAHAAGLVVVNTTHASSGPVAEWALARAEPAWRNLPDSVTTTRATSSDGRRLHFVFNWSFARAEVKLPFAVRDALGPDHHAAGESLTLGPWDVRVLQTRLDR